jgi:queuosine precursor transporter
LGHGKLIGATVVVAHEVGRLFLSFDRCRICPDCSITSCDCGSSGRPTSMDNRLRYFLFLMTLHSSLLITSTIAGAKVFALPFGLTASATVLSYMMTFVILVSIAELYGRAYSRFVINLGLLGMAISAVYFEFAIMLPPADFWQEQRALVVILGSSWRIWLGGWTAYLISQYLDLWSFLKLKDLAGGRRLVMRAWLSMLIGQLIDTSIFIVIAFYGTDPVGPLILGQYLVKIIIATFASPLVSVVVSFGRRVIGDAKPSDGTAPELR